MQVIALGAMVAFVSLAADASSQQGAGTAARATGLFGIVPPKVILRGRPPRSIPPTQVLNTTKSDFHVRIFAARLIQALDGTFDIDPSRSSTYAASRITTVTPDKFELASGRQFRLRTHWNLLPRGQEFAGIGIVIEGQPAEKSPGVQPVSRLIQVNLLQTPGRHRVTGDITAFRAEQAPKKTLVFTTRLKNTGEVPAAPAHGHISIQDASGKTIVPRVDWQGGQPGAPAIILPGFQREFPATLTKVLPAGKYSVATAARFGGHLVRSSLSMTLAGPNELPTLELAIPELRAGGRIDDPAKIDGVLQDSGTKNGDAQLVIELVKLTPSGPDRSSVVKRTLPERDLKPGEQRRFSVELGKVAKGSYGVTVRATAPGARPVARSTTFVAQPARSFWDKYGTLLLALAGLLLLLLLALLLRSHRDRRRRAAELAPPAGAAAGNVPPQEAHVRAPAAVGGVNLNTANAEELQRLPGVGPKAAERIIEHRNEYGRFTSLEDLHAVEGFDAERVAALGDQAEV